jgi:hypothetical protein
MGVAFRVSLTAVVLVESTTGVLGLIVVLFEGLLSVWFEDGLRTLAAN